MMSGGLLILPLEEHQHANPCPACEGQGVTGERYEMPAGDQVLLIEVICPDCEGCGNGDPGHAGCKPDWHAYPEDHGGPDPFGDELDEDGTDAEVADEDIARTEPVCYSCHTGRGWNAVQAFRGEGDETEMVVSRVPCGCSAGRLTEVASG
jgi:hypothetical protein